LVLRDKHGFTGIADAMFFIVIIGIASSALAGYMADDQSSNPDDPSEFADTVFTGRISGEEFGYDEISRTEDVATYTAASLLMEDGVAEGYLEPLIDGMYGDPGRYCMTVSCGDCSLTLGGFPEEPTASYEQTYPTPYGDLGVLIELA
jgi:hypothetical protein